MPLISFEINLQLKWSANWCIVTGTAANQGPACTITDTNKTLCFSYNFIN